MSTKPNVLIRRAQPADGIKIHRLLQECGAALARDGFMNWSPPVDLERVMSDVATAEVYVAMVGDQLAGAVTLLSDGTVKRLAVAPAQQGNGVGAHLTLFVEARALEVGHTVLKLDALAANAALIRFYERAGYSTTFEHERDGWRFARMTKELR